MKQFITMSANVHVRVNAGGSQYIFGDFLVIFGAGDVYIQSTEQGDSEQQGRTPKMESGCATTLVKGRQIRSQPSHMAALD